MVIFYPSKDEDVGRNTLLSMLIPTHKTIDSCKLTFAANFPLYLNNFQESWQLPNHFGVTCIVLKLWDHWNFFSVSIIFLTQKHKHWSECLNIRLGIECQDLYCLWLPVCLFLSLHAIITWIFSEAHRLLLTKRAWNIYYVSDCIRQQAYNSHRSFR